MQSGSHHDAQVIATTAANPPQPQKRTRIRRVPKTRWARMERTELSLAHLRQLLLTGKRSEGKAPKTIA